MIRALFLSLTLSASAMAAEPPDFSEQLELFADEMVAKHGLPEAATRTLITNARYHQSIIDAITRPAESLSWKRYRPIFVTDARAQEGVEYWEKNKILLEQAQARYGVPPEIIVAIIGVETRYGRHEGKYPVVDALATLGFGYPKRAKFFRKQLEEFLLMSREHQVDAATAKGSYAGAMGQPQFIPSSYRAYAVDFDKDGKTDLWDSHADIIGSVAAYFSRHQWQPGGAIAVQLPEPLASTNPHYVEPGQRTSKPSVSLGELRQAGIDTGNWPDEEMATLVHLNGRAGSEFWLTLPNFYVITRYNHSNLYAMAVFQLSQKILHLYQAKK